MIRKYGSPFKIHIIKEGAFEFDPNLLVKQIKESWGKNTITIDELHEFVKAKGIVDYSSEAMNEVIRLLRSISIPVLD